MEKMESVSLSDEGGDEDTIPAPEQTAEENHDQQLEEEAPAPDTGQASGAAEEVSQDQPTETECSADQPEESPEEGPPQGHLEQEVVRLETQRGQLASEVLAKENVISDLELNNARFKSQVEQLETQLKANEDAFAAKIASMNEEVKMEL